MQQISIFYFPSFVCPNSNFANKCFVYVNHSSLNKLYVQYSTEQKQQIYKPNFKIRSLIIPIKTIEIMILNTRKYLQFFKMVLISVLKCNIEYKDDFNNKQVQNKFKLIQYDEVKCKMPFIIQQNDIFDLLQHTAFIIQQNDIFYSILHSLYSKTTSFTVYCIHYTAKRHLLLHTAFIIQQNDIFYCILHS